VQTDLDRLFLANGKLGQSGSGSPVDLNFPFADNPLGASTCHGGGLGKITGQCSE
jgi:hypothetical protein